MVLMKKTESLTIPDNRPASGVDKMDSSIQITTYWHSDPVVSEEVVMVSGSGFSSELIVHVAHTALPGKDLTSEILPDSKALKWKEAKILQASSDTLMFTIPKEFSMGIYVFKLSSGKLR